MKPGGEVTRTPRTRFGDRQSVLRVKKLRERISVASSLWNIASIYALRPSVETCGGHGVHGDKGVTEGVKRGRGWGRGWTIRLYFQPLCNSGRGSTSSTSLAGSSQTFKRLADTNKGKLSRDTFFSLVFVILKLCNNLRHLVRIGGVSVREKLCDLCRLVVALYGEVFSCRCLLLMSSVDSNRLPAS